MGKYPKAPPDAKLYLDLGRVSEDVIPNRKLDTEDRPPGNNAIDDVDEDTGIDGLMNGEENNPDLNELIRRCLLRLKIPAVMIFIYHRVLPEF